MKLQKKILLNTNDNLKFKYIEPDITSFNKTFGNSHTTKNSKKNSNLNIISLNSFTNPIKLKIKNSKDQIIYTKNKNSFNKNNANIRNNKTKNTSIKFITNNNDINKIIINSSYSNSLNRKEHNNNNSLNILGIGNIKERFYPNKEVSDKNKLNLKKKRDIKINSYSLKNHFSFFKNKKKIKENRNKTSNEKDDIGNNYLRTEYLTEENKENNNSNNVSNIFLKNSVDNKKLIHYIKKKNYDFYENEFNLENKENLTKDEISLLIKKYHLLLEENYLYKKKIIILQKENKKLKEENNINYRDNNQLREDNEILKKEIITLKNKINELIDNKNKIFKEKNDETHLTNLISCCNSINKVSNPTSESYIRKLEKKNEELTNIILDYQKMFKLSNK